MADTLGLKHIERLEKRALEASSHGRLLGIEPADTLLLIDEVRRHRPRPTPIQEPSPPDAVEASAAWHKAHPGADSSAEGVSQHYDGFIAGFAAGRASVKTEQATAQAKPAPPKPTTNG